MSERSVVDRTLQSWALIEARLLVRSPRGLVGLNGPAADADLSALESETGMRLPESLRVVLKLHDGASTPSVFGDDFQFLSSRQMVEHWRMHVGVLSHVPAEALVGIFDPAIIERCDVGVKPVVANRKWLPFADSNCDVTRYIDFDPAPGGCLGQVIEVDPEATSWRVLAPSFDAYLADP